MKDDLRAFLHEQFHRARADAARAARDDRNLAVHQTHVFLPDFSARRFREAAGEVNRWKLPPSP